MDAIVQQSCNADLFSGCSLIYLHCCDFCYKFNFTVPSLPFLNIEGLFAHFSFWNSPSERRMCILPLSRELLKTLDGIKSPVVVEVKSSVIFEFKPDESEEKSMLLIWDFWIKEDQTEKVSPQRPMMPDTEALSIAPLLDIEKVKQGRGCNCTTFPSTNDVFVNLKDMEEEDEFCDSASNTTQERRLSDEESCSSSDDEEGTLHTLAFKCIGAAHEKPRQESLKIAAKVSNRKKIEARLRPEPTNEKDKEAIAIDINCGNGYFHAGYIASELTKYLHPLMATNKIVDVSVEHIIQRVYFAKMGYYPKILITRKGAWEKYVIYRCRGTM